eukprot:CAMPEP_0174299880 /NCGR_PEP_ID=MMETSP0809-20121228/57880_1 /TAXON_ID=73025 ORGANISM="Eutreptiella gymnastica-like, Strain CCMP1594" /NCGR_SAMPLE_ID=MMETSP0809 /ASSEMBLY_ACC=CAM_ASM_000658 /LENGTH=64 /DNA_ID=CAMNT_0015405345 /DNA_START=288 /DNA_END=479 /DNA_ORIENTATION=-
MRDVGRLMVYVLQPLSLEDLSEAINGALQILAAGDSVSVSVRELCRAPVRAALSRPFGGILNNA